MKARLLIATGVLVAAGAGPLSAQVFYIGLRGGIASPTESFGESAGATAPDALLAGAKTGFGYGLDVGLGLGPLGLYGGLDRIDFDCRADSCASSGEYELTGASAGLRLGIPLFPLVKPWVKAGVTFNELEGTIGTGAGATRITTERGPGYEIAAGFDIPVLVLFSLTPQVRYVSQKLEYDTGSTGSPTGEKNVNYYTVDIGFRLRTPF